MAGGYFVGFGLLNFPTRIGSDNLLINVALGIWGLAEGAVNVRRAINYLSYSGQLREEIRVLTGTVSAESTVGSSGLAAVSPSTLEINP